MTSACVIGCGRMGRRHLRALQALGVALAGVVDLRGEAVKEALEECLLPTALGYVSFEALLDRRIPDLAIIATTADSHCACVIKAAEAGVTHILCEKPMAVSIAQCEEMIQACAARGARLAINHPVRFTEADVAIKKRLQSPEMGGLSAIHVSAGNFGLAMNASHNIEMFRFMCDEMPVAVQAWFDEEIVPNPRGEAFQDRSGQLRVRTASGKLLTINASSQNGHGVFIVYAAAYGQIAYNALTGDALVSFRKEEYRDRPTTLYSLPAENRIETFASSDLVGRCARVIEALMGEGDYPDGETGKRTIEILAGAYRSHENGSREINVTHDDLPRGRMFPWA